ncbi:hypothetical protein P170DRAFT_271705 [Aspergillus steynii IBT 23096]|uniref:Uncharacterized protein n=1 Tax=Aspergillus steynii IBT 23096 TaxID=1392250 RepID=A0A2I2FWN5_9EURO|nr:uncharacterized protein P170DRAFT_271705 [Aspergillus steynii IBT 23096]PLB45051.1 hypothetical protein P170DRAFT_271705 [Aspergillus steynii IBT 23096]
MRFSLAALSTVLLMGAVYASPAPGGGEDEMPDKHEKGGKHGYDGGKHGYDGGKHGDDGGKIINIEHLEYVTNKYTCVEENHTIDLALLTEAGDGCAKSALLELGLLNIL